MIRVLICTEEGMVALFLQHVLERAGYAVVGEASNGRAAVKLAQTFCPDLILMDACLADANGIPVARELMDQTQRPIILLNDLPLEKDTQDALSGRACACLQKPFDGDQVLQAIETARLLFRAVRTPALRKGATLLRRCAKKSRYLARANRRSSLSGNGFRMRKDQRRLGWRSMKRSRPCR